MNIFLVNQDNPHAKTLMMKLAEKAKPDAIIPLTSGEMGLYESPDFKHIITDTNNSPIDISEIKKGGSYVAVVKVGMVNIDDLLEMATILKVNLSIVRTQ